MFGRSVARPAAARRARHRHFIARPASMTASLEPIVDTPTAPPSSGALNRSATMFTQRRSISAVCGYSSLSIMFLSNVSAIRRSASGSIHVDTNVAMFNRELPSSISSSWMMRYTSFAVDSLSGMRFFGIGFTLSRPVKGGSRSSNTGSSPGGTCLWTIDIPARARGPPGVARADTTAATRRPFSDASQRPAAALASCWPPPSHASGPIVVCGSVSAGLADNHPGWMRARLPDRRRP